METILNLYNSYRNDFLTISCFAEYYGLCVSEAQNIIEQGKALNNGEYWGF